MDAITAALDRPHYQPGDVMTLTVQIKPPADSTVVVPLSLAAYDDLHTVDFTVPAWRLDVADPDLDWFQEFSNGAGAVFTAVAPAGATGTVTARLDWLGGSATACVAYTVREPVEG